MNAHRSARGRWLPPSRWAALVLLAAALTVMHLAVVTSAHGGRAHRTRHRTR